MVKKKTPALIAETPAETAPEATSYDDGHISEKTFSAADAVHSSRYSLDTNVQPSIQDIDPDADPSEFSTAPISPRGAFAKGQEINKGVIEAIRRSGSPGTQKTLADSMGVSNVTVHKWLYESLPAERAIEIEKKHGVSRRVLRPDLFNDEELVFSKSIELSEANKNRYRTIEED